MKMGGGRVLRTRKEFRQLRQRHQLQERITHRPKEVTDEQGIPYVTSGTSSLWLPTGSTAFKLLLSARLSAAFWSIISDCDETFNYWEIAHFVLFGRGFQTWEYSPEFALRSYLYVLIYAVPGGIYNLLFQGLNHMYIFYFLRCLLALVSSACELYFFQGIVKEVGVNVGRLTLAFMAFSTGLFISSTAFLPSSTSMYLVMLSHGAWFHQSYALAIFFTALSAFISWPFAALLGIPIAVDIVLRKGKLSFFVNWCLISAITILIPQILIDSDYYGRFVFASFNLVRYNVFTSHGPDLYGTEPHHFYLINGLLNFNVALIAASIVIPMHLLVKTLVGLPSPSHHFIPHWLVHLSLYLWVFIFGIQPHKEERFMFPVYPLLCLAAASTLDLLQKLYYFLFVRIKKNHYLTHASWISVGTLTVYGLLCLSRASALYQNYHAPIDVWMHVAHLPRVDPDRYPPHRHVNVCIGKEWHRFPSSFFLPNDDWSLKFIRSEFRGQLPQPFDSADVRNATKLVRGTFNDRNREEMNRYVTNVQTQCDFIVDLETPESETSLEPTYSKDSSHWEEETSVEFLDVNNSHKLFRAFYVPFLSRSRCNFTKYVLLRNVKKSRQYLQDGGKWH